MSFESPSSAKPNRVNRASARKKYLKIPYIYIRLFVPVLAAFCIIFGFSVSRIRQYQVSEHASESEYAKLLKDFNELEARANELAAKLNMEEYKNDSTRMTLNRQAAKLNEQDSQYAQDIDEFEKKTEELQKKLEDLEKAKEDIINQLNEIPYLPGITSLPASEPVTLAVTYSSDPIQSLAFKLDSINYNANIDLMAYRELTDTFNQIKPALDAYPCMWPAKGKVTSGFGKRQSPMGGNYSEDHSGLDIAVPMYTNVKATGGGIVKLAEYADGYGYLVIIDHGMGMETYYGHNSELLVSAGDKVTRGQVVSKSGNTGNSTGPNVHYEVRINGKPVNPVKYVTMSD